MQTENNHQGVDDGKPDAAKSPLTEYVLFGEIGEQVLSTFSCQVMKIPGDRTKLSEKQLYNSTSAHSWIWNRLESFEPQMDLHRSVLSPMSFQSIRTTSQAQASESVLHAFSYEFTIHSCWSQVDAVQDSHDLSESRI